MHGMPNNAEAHIEIVRVFLGILGGDRTEREAGREIRLVDSCDRCTRSAVDPWIIAIRDTGHSQDGDCGRTARNKHGIGAPSGRFIQGVAYAQSPI